MNNNESEKDIPLDGYKTCSNCRKKILSSKMFLHEGFCMRNNKYCEKCGKIVLIKDFDDHIQNHLNPQTKSPLNEESINLNKDLKKEKINDNKDKTQVMVNQINYNSYVNMSIPKKAKKKEIIKYNAPIVINTFDNEIHTPGYYKDFFLRNYKMAKLMKINEFDDILENSKVLTSDILESKNNENPYNINDIFMRYNINYLNENNRQYSLNAIRKPNFFLDNNKEKKETTNYDNPIILYERSDNKKEPDDNINFDQCYKNIIKIPKNRVKRNICSNSYDSKKYNDIYDNIFSNGSDYKINNYIIRNKNLINKIPLKNYHSNVLGNDNINYNSSGNFSSKEPLDRTSKLNKINKHKEGKEIKPSNIEFNNKFILYGKAKNSKYEKCEYCNRVVEDMNKHNYRCEIRRMKELERIQSIQEDKKMIQSKEIDIHKPKNIKLSSYSNLVLKNGFIIEKQKKEQKIHYSCFQNEKIDQNGRIILTPKSSKIISQNCPTDTKREEQIKKRQERKFYNNINQISDILYNYGFNEINEKDNYIDSWRSKANLKKNLIIKLPDNKAYRGLLTP